MKIGSLCTGYGGLDMAVEAHFNARTVWCSEFDKHASKLIETRLGTKNYGDLKKIDWANIEPVDIITAGYPCQPFSHAGHRKGTDDPRHLFPYILQAISLLRPSYVILENVRGHLNLGFSEVLGHLASIGYSARWRTIRAADIGAPHPRERLFILAYPNNSEPGDTQPGGCMENSEYRDNSDSYANANTFDSRGIRDMQGLQSRLNSLADLQVQAITNANTDAHKELRRTGGELPSESTGLQRGQDQGQAGRFDWGSSAYGAAIHRWESLTRLAPEPLVNENKLNPEFVEWMMGLPYGWVTSVDIPRSQKLKILGNGVVPQQAYEAIRLLLTQRMTNYQANLFSYDKLSTGVIHSPTNPVHN